MQRSGGETSLHSAPGPGCALVFLPQLDHLQPVLFCLVDAQFNIDKKQVIIQKTHPPAIFHANMNNIDTVLLVFIYIVMIKFYLVFTAYKRTNAAGLEIVF